MDAVTEHTGARFSRKPGKAGASTPALPLICSWSRNGLAPCLSFPFCKRGIFLLPPGRIDNREQQKQSPVLHL